MSCARRSGGRCPTARVILARSSKPSQLPPSKAWSPFRAGATSASSSAARCRPRSRPTGSPRPGTRTRASSSAGPRPRWSRRWPAGGSGTCSASRRTASFAFVTGCQIAHVTCLAAARHAVLERVGWDVEETGSPAPRRSRWSRAAKRHVTVDRALRLLGLGTASASGSTSTLRAGCASRGWRRRYDGSRGPTIVCAQAGKVNTGAFDAFDEIATLRRDTGAWLHVDGAFGLWAAARPALRHLRRRRARRLVGHRRPQMAQRPVRHRPGVRRAPRGTPCGDAAHRRLPGSRPERRARPDGLDAGVLAPRSRLRGLRGAALARPNGCRGARRAHLRARRQFAERDRRPARVRGPERRRAQPGALPVRGRRHDRRRCSRPSRRAARHG